MALQDAYALAGVENTRELRQVYDQEDQRLMKGGMWDYDNPALLVNRIKAALDGEAYNPILYSDDREWCAEILWFWHHHAISCAIWRKKDRAAARFHAISALQYQGQDHPNKITRLLYLLVHDRVDDAVRWCGEIVDEVEKETAVSLLVEYRDGGFF